LLNYNSHCFDTTLLYLTQFNKTQRYLITAGTQSKHSHLTETNNGNINDTHQ